MARGLFSLFWDIGFGHLQDNAEISQAKLTSADSTPRVTDASREMKALAGRIDRLTLICMALWSLLRERTDLAEDDLMERVKQIDLSDGRSDGKVRRKPIVRCPRCNRVMSQKHSRCLYCGAEDLEATAFDSVL